MRRQRKARALRWIRGAVLAKEAPVTSTRQSAFRSMRTTLSALPALLRASSFLTETNNTLRGLAGLRASRRLGVSGFRRKQQPHRPRRQARQQSALRRNGQRTRLVRYVGGLRLCAGARGEADSAVLRRAGATLRHGVSFRSNDGLALIALSSCFPNEREKASMFFCKKTKQHAFAYPTSAAGASNKSAICCMGRNRRSGVCWNGRKSKCL